MPKTLYGHSIGANVYEKDAPQGVKIVPDNKTLMAMQFNDEPDDEINPVRIKNMKELFAQYQPSKEVVLKSSDGESEEKVFKFNNLKDFTKDGIIEQSEVLQQLQEQENVYARLVDVMKNNDNLRNVVSNDDTKKDFIELLGTLIEELTETE